MLKKIFGYFLNGYTDSSIEIQKKAQLLLIIAFIVSVFTLSLNFLVLKNTAAMIFLETIIICCIATIALIKIKKYKIASLFFNIFFTTLTLAFSFSIESSADFLVYYICESFISASILISCVISHKRYYPIIVLTIGLIFIVSISFIRFPEVKVLIDKLTDIRGLLMLELVMGVGIVGFIVIYHNKDIIKIAENKAKDFENAFAESQKTAGDLKKAYKLLTEVLEKAKDIIIKLNSTSREIEAAAQEQTSAANEHASGVTEVSATLEELTITARQITANVGDLVIASGEAIKMLKSGKDELLQTISQLEDAGKMSSSNTGQIGELGKRSVIINEMVEIIKEVANKTNMLSINASIEASRAGEAGKGFSVVAAEIRELSRETIASAKKVEKAAREIEDFLNDIIFSSENESEKVIKSGKNVKNTTDNIENVMSTINNNYTFSQKIDVSIKQQENGSKQATETMRQMAEIARQSAETARQTLLAVRNIVSLSEELDVITKLLDKSGGIL